MAAGALAVAPALPAVASPRTHTIVVDKMKFGPAPAGVRVGDTVTWVNRDLFRHSATASNRAFDVDLPPGATGTAVMRTAGTFPYICRFHTAMTAQIVVAP
ncbi:cupredoxin domain-containing protein [Brevundimonas sp.]|uniref:cupredoxin domain-containing protein n=1 Tax=Brevundimonas sp. TaxID=1871086 RepID=UPI003D6CC5C4